MHRRAVQRLAAIAALAVAVALALPAGPAAAGGPLCFGEVPTIYGTPGDDLGPDSIFGTDGPDVIHGLGGDDAIYGLGGKDLICGGDGQDITLNGGPGNDKIDGGASGRDALSFVDFGPPAGVVANLATGTATGVASGKDTFKNVESIQGTFYNDKLTGDGKSNLLVGMDGNDRIFGGGGQDMITGDGGLYGPGDDTLDGGRGVDYVSFSGSSGPVEADLAAGSAIGEGSDTLTGFEAAIGSNFGDRLLGTKGRNFFVGDPLGNPGTGNDIIDGRGGVDYILYLFAPGPVTANLSSGIATGEGTDELHAIEAIFGTPFDDSLTGNGSENALFGGGGGDDLFGLGKADYLDGQDGVDTGDGGGGNDQCLRLEVKSNCESSKQSSPYQQDVLIGTEGFRKR